MKVKYGDVVYLKNAIPAIEHIQGENRPFLIVSNDMGNRYSEICLCVPLTKSGKKISQPTHTFISYHNSMCLCEQIFTIPQSNVSKVVFHSPLSDMNKVKYCLRKALQL